MLIVIRAFILHCHITANYFLIAKIVVAQDTMECTERSILSYRGIEFQF